MATRIARNHGANPIHLLKKLNIYNYSQTLRKINNAVSINKLTQGTIGKLINDYADRK
jgi:hypothetical protein